MKIFKTVALGLLCIVVCGSTMAQSSQQKKADTDYENQIKELKEALANLQDQYNTDINEILAKISKLEEAKAEWKQALKITDDPEMKDYIVESEKQAREARRKLQQKQREAEAAEREKQNELARQKKAKERAAKEKQRELERMQRDKEKAAREAEKEAQRAQDKLDREKKAAEKQKQQEPL